MLTSTAVASNPESSEEQIPHDKLLKPSSQYIAKVSDAAQRCVTVVMYCEQAIASHRISLHHIARIELMSIFVRCDATRRV